MDITAKELFEEKAEALSNWFWGILNANFDLNFFF